MSTVFQVWSLILSDIIGDPLHLIASGPTIPHSNSRVNALTICDKYNILGHIPSSVQSVLSRPDVRKLPVFESGNVVNALIGSNDIALKVAASEADKHNYFVVCLGRSLCGEAKSLGHVFGQLGHYLQFFESFTNEEKLLFKHRIASGFVEHDAQAENVQSIFHAMESGPLHSKTCSGLCVIGGGETTVTLQENCGKGGRNQEMVLSAAIELHASKNASSNCPNGSILFLSAGTDGQDGPTPAAGAFVDSELLNTFDAARATEHLNNHDSYSFFKRMDYGLVNTGLTGTNVMDVHILMWSFT